MNSIQLEYFLAVARTGSFTAAARQLYLSQPALSKQIHLLEEELGSVLLIRRPRGAVLTAEGRKLMARAGEVAAIMKAIPSEINELHHTVSGELKIVCGPFLSRRVMPGLLKRLLERYPGIAPRIRETVSPQQTELLLNGDAEVALGMLRAAHPHLSSHPLFRSDLVLIRSRRSDLAAKKRVTRKEIAERKLVNYPPGSAMYEAVRRCLAPYPVNVFMESSSSSTIIELVKEDFGLALVPDYLIEPEQRGGIIVGGFDSGESVTIGYRYCPERQLSPQAKAFIAVIRETYGVTED